MSKRAAKLHDSPWQGVFYLTGGASGFLAEILSEPGASRTVLEARVPYASRALAELLGKAPEQACSEATARALAMAAFQRARELGGTSAFGLSCTASLAWDRVKKGEHRAHAALQTADSTFTASWRLDGSRQAEEAELLEYLWRKLSQALGLDGVTSLVHDVDLAQTRAKPTWRKLVLGEIRAAATAEHDAQLLLPGAFNPLHQAHTSMLSLAEKVTRLTGAFELSVANVDKPFLDYREIETRLAQFDRPVWLTHLPTFLEKARHFPGSHFAVGMDTFVRVVDAKYYGGEQAMKDAFVELEALDTRFVVFGRELEGRFKVLGDLVLPDWLNHWQREHCIEVSERSFSEKVSSTELRQTAP